MKIRDLADPRMESATGKSAKPAAPQNPRQESPAASSWGPVPEGIAWIVLEWKPLSDEPFVVVFDRRWLKEARGEHPGKVIYFPPEMKEVARYKHDPAFLKLLHQAKKEFAGWIVPQDSPEYVPFEKLRGLIEDR